MTMMVSLLNALSKAMNAYLKLDAESSTRLKKLEDRTLTIELLPFQFVFQCTFNASGVVLTMNDELPSEARLTGTPLQLLGAMVFKQNRHGFFAEDLTITGDASLAHEVTKLFDEFEFDWQEWLSYFVGDVTTHHVSRLVHDLKNWAEDSKESLNENVKAYLHEEKNWLPPAEALNDFFHDVDAVRMDVDRLEAQINQLMGALANPQSNKGSA